MQRIKCGFAAYRSHQLSRSSRQLNFFPSFRLRRTYAIYTSPSQSSVYCDPGVTRTRDPQLRRLLLYPPELRGQNFISHGHLNPTSSSIRLSISARIISGAENMADKSCWVTSFLMNIKKYKKLAVETTVTPWLFKAIRGYQIAFPFNCTI
jgi:hypothetical protein